MSDLTEQGLTRETAGCPGWCSYPLPHRHTTSADASAARDRSYSSLAVSALQSSQRALRLWGAWQSARRRAAAAEARAKTAERQVAAVEAEFGGKCLRLRVGERFNCPSGGLTRSAWCDSCLLRTALSIDEPEETP